MKIYDISQEVFSCQVYPGDPAPEKELISSMEKGDSYNLVTVIYSLTLFLLGIIGTFKNMPNKITVLAIAVF